jgi:repressor LexA
MPKLTNRQRDIFNVIKDYIDVNGFAPSYRDLAKLSGLKSTSTVSDHLKQLKAKGYVNFIVGSPRTLTIKKSPL